MAKLQYTEEEILADHDYAELHYENGVRLHGGFLADGSYRSPRTLNRWPAIRAWQGALQENGGTLLNVTTELLKHGSFPTFAQQSLLIRNGIGQGFWNSLTTTGIIEGRGRMLADIVAPDFQEIIVEDVSNSATAHLNKGLFKAHGYDEGGWEEKGEGGHDVMWFAVRDLIFGEGAFPLVEPSDRGGRPGADTREMPDIPEQYEGVLKSLMNVLMIEIRAEHFFNFCSDVICDPDLFHERREEADHAAELVDRIKEDEASHVGYLVTWISELCNFTFKLADGTTKPGSEIILPVWERIADFQANVVPLAGRDDERKAIEERIATLPAADNVRAEFERLSA